MGKTQDREGDQEAKRLFQLIVEGPIKVTWRQIWFDLIAVRTPPGKTGQQNRAVPAGLWKAFNREQRFGSAQPDPPIPDAPRCSSRGLGDTGLVRVGASHSLATGCRPRVPRGEGCGGTWRPHSELILYWSPRNKQKLTSLVGTGAGGALTRGDPQVFPAPSVPSMVTEGKQLRPGRSL